jgi:hypothetical protein
MRWTLLVAVATLAVAVALAQADSYEVINVPDGGSIAGRVTYVGTPPTPERVVVDADRDVCGKEERRSSALLVGSKGGIRNTVVHLRSITRGKAWTAHDFTLGQTNCEFDPRVLLIREGADLHLVNNDRIAHSVHGGEVNIGQPKFVEKMVVPDFTGLVSEQSVIRMGCDIHKWMRAWVVVQKHPYYAVSDDSGAFQLTGVPPGQYELEVWHETLGQRTQTVSVRPNAETVVTFRLP